jgi:Zn-dependent peptidase ImmA (M78 family)
MRRTSRRTSRGCWRARGRASTTGRRRCGGCTVERWIFTAVHELGHLLLHGEAYDVKRTTENQKEEDEADNFAGRFLKPEKVFAKEWDDTSGRDFTDRVVKVKSIFNVSWKAVLRSAYPGTRTWDQVFRNEFEKKTGQRLGENDEPFRLPPAKFMSDRLDRLVRRAMTKGLITPERGAEILGIDMAEMRGRVALWQVT